MCENGAKEYLQIHPFRVAFLLELELPFQMYSLVLKRTRFPPGSFLGTGIVVHGFKSSRDFVCQVTLYDMSHLLSSLRPLQ